MVIRSLYISALLPRGCQPAVISHGRGDDDLYDGLIVMSSHRPLWTLAIVFLIPQRIGLTVLAGGSTGCPTTVWRAQRSNRYRATRNRVGAR